MATSSIFLDFSLLKNNAHFRAIFIARMLSVFALGMLTVGVPVQMQFLTGSTLQVGIVVALDGAGMFIGLILGGILADRYDRRKLILFARGTCGIGFVALSFNAFLDSPSLYMLYFLSIWDGFFGALGMTALMAAIPNLVGRENLAAAGALSMITVRIGAIISPALAGIIIVAGGPGWNFAVAAIGTLATLLPLMRLPEMRPQPGKQEHPINALISGVKFVCQHKIVGSVILVGMMISIAGAVRILFPALSQEVYHQGPSATGLMYSAVPLGAMLGAFTSGWIGRSNRPGVLLIICALCSFITLSMLGVVTNIVLALLVLVCYGYLNAFASLLQFTLVQSHTPDHLLGRVNSFVTAQDVTGDSLGALGLGFMGRLLSPVITVFSFGTFAALTCLLLAAIVKPLRHSTLRDGIPLPETSTLKHEPQQSDH
ncbi:enterobactin transporter EntS [Xenorhabdus eapokensis]|uniref:Enterobactin exporter EntS n=1 Tax=Xenorhabdus eapokensis TaxID=1873482 RepID=A0A1Q5TTA0_9GAMM|nr:enterobactin transporter EntS [Xenorhabdus eapokensis]OKP03466.1 putative siderophore exporter [Xenorhabdus eapokensis]